MWQKNVRYLDYNAGSGLSASVQNKLKEALSDDSLFWANPSSRHRPGQKIQRLLYQASLKIAASLGPAISPDDLVFTSSGTEASQTVIRSGLEGGSPGSAVVIGAGEHSASHDLLNEIREKMSLARELPLLPNGEYDLARLAEFFSEVRTLGIERVFVSLFWANNETGVLTDLEALKRVISDSGLSVVLHLDAAQVWGKIPIDLTSTPAQFVTFSAHKIGAPAGSGMIWVRPGQSLRPLFPGSQSRGLRAGTENTFGILSMGYACESLDSALFIAHTGLLRDAFEQALIQSGIPVEIWGRTANRVSNTSRFSLTSFRTYENWVELLDLKGFAVSHGSACKAQVIEPSRVLLAMGASREAALNSIRVSFGPSNTMDDVNGLIEALRLIYEAKVMPFKSEARP